MTPTFDLAAKQFWATTFYSRLWEEHAAQSPALLEYLYSLRAAEPARIASGVAPGAKSAAGLHESGFDLFAGDHPALNRLKGFVGRTVQAAAAHANGGTVDPRHLRVEVPDSWFHITNDGGFHDAHYHGACSWCGIYYVRVGESGPPAGGGAPNGGSRFYSPLSSGGGYRDYGNAYLDFNFTDAPIRDGLLVLFPSYLMHAGLPYRGAADRVVIAFNARVTPAGPAASGR